MDGVSFTARPGEVLGLLGPNGAGKTTTLRMIATAIRPTAGTIAVAGHDALRHPECVRRHLGFLTANTGLYGRLTPREVLRYFGQLFRIPAAHLNARIDHLAAEFDMADYLDRQCDTLSTGMKQKVNIARSILHDPPVIVLDEPTSGLDVLTSRSITTFIRRSRAEGRTVLFSSHIMGEVERLCDRVALMHRGRIWFTGTLAEYRAEYGDDLEEAFLKAVGEAPE